MKTLITVTTRKEAAAIRAALNLLDVRAFVVTMGTLAQLPSDDARRRVLTFVADTLREEASR